MTVGPGSRTAARQIVEAPGRDGKPRPVAALQFAPAQPPAVTQQHVVRKGETIDLLARQYLGDERLWTAILDANPIIHPFDLRPGDTLSIPLPAAPTQARRARRF